MSAAIQPTMLWENSNPHTVLAQRFHFATTDDATHWLIDRIGSTYGLTVVSVDRLVMSSYNLLAWLTTTQGALLAKCCAFVTAHQRLRQVGELVVWLEQMTLPVAAPLVATVGSVQVLCDHLSISLQRVIPGELLDPTQSVQATKAGVVLAQLHQALATYPYATALATPAPIPSLPTQLAQWAQQKKATLADPTLIANLASLQAQVGQLATTTLPTQLVHGDYRAANVLWRENDIAAVLDFEEVRWGYRVNDLAWAAVHLGTRYHDWGPLALAVQQTFLQSYRAAHPLDAAEEAWLPALLAWHSLTLTLQTTADNPAYQIGLETIAFYLELLQTDRPLP